MTEIIVKHKISYEYLECLITKYHNKEIQLSDKELKEILTALTIMDILGD